MTLREFYNVWILTCFISLTLWLMDFQCLLHWVASPAWITWSSPGQLLLLVKSHIGEKAYVCNQCGGGFSKHFSLKQHRAFRLEKNHYESRCGKAFSAYSVLRQPQKPRNGEKPCEWMQMNFIQSVHLHRHQRTHTGGSYINIINVGKMSAGELTFIHFRGPSLTNYWWKAFIDHLTFKKHEQIHIGEQPGSVISVEGPPVELHSWCARENSELD